MKLAASSSSPIKRNKPRIMRPPKLAPQPEIAVDPCYFNRNSRVLTGSIPLRPRPALTMARGALIRRPDGGRADMLAADVLSGTVWKHLQAARCGRHSIGAGGLVRRIARAWRIRLPPARRPAR